MSHRGYTYYSDEFINLGDAGEHPVALTYYHYNQVEIVLATVEIVNGGDRQIWDVTQFVKDSNFWREDALQDYQSRFQEGA